MDKSTTLQGGSICLKDDFLEIDIFRELQNSLINDPIWKFEDGIDFNDDEKGQFQFVHVFVLSGHPFSPFYSSIAPVLERIDPLTFLSVKANLLTRTQEVRENSFHKDLEIIEDENRMKQWQTGILYCNTNNGYTLFEDGTKINSVENRFVTFPSNMAHKGTTCSDENKRIVLNFNFFAK